MKKLMRFLPLLIAGISSAQNLYDIDHITTIDIVFAESDWDAIMDTYYANDLDEMLVGTVTLNGVVYEGAGVKFKGNSTYSAGNSKNPLNIQLDYTYDVKYQGYSTLKLSSGRNDPSFLREVLSYEIGRKYMDMPLSNYAYVTINGADYGLFSCSESINGDYVERRFFSDRDNPRFKCNPNDVMGGGSSLTYYGSDSSYYFNYYELKTDIGWNALVNLCQNLTTSIGTIETLIDVDRALWMLAFNNVMANMDSYSGPFRQNYYLIQDDFGRFLPVIWDLNESIGGFEMVNSSTGGPPSPPVLTDLTEADVFLREGDADWPLIYYLFQVDRYKKMYLAHCKTIYLENLAGNEYYSRAEEIQGYIETSATSDPNAIYTATQFYDNIDVSAGTGMGATYGIYQVMNGRKAFLSTSAEFGWLDPTISAVTHLPSTPINGDVITVTATIVDANYAYLGYRTGISGPFTKLEMFDDGAHGDGAALDGVYGAMFSATASDVQYYIYADNANAGKFSPVRAEHEYYVITISNSVVLNEIMPKNNGTVMDQDNEYDDWIEIFNPTAGAIDISGYALSDDPLILDKFVFPSGTTIAANAYIIVWCDQDTLQSGYHANFKLSSGGETILLSNAGLNVVNEVFYPEIEHGNTYGRYVNGTGAFQRLLPTYAASNSYTALGNENLTEETAELTLFPNPTQEQFRISGLVNAEEIVIFDLMGNLVLQTNVSENDIIDVTHLPKGMYLIYFNDSGKTLKLNKL